MIPLNTPPGTEIVAIEDHEHAWIAAYDAQCEQQAKRLEHERAVTKAKGSISEAFVRAADALVGEKELNK